MKKYKIFLFAIIFLSLTSASLADSMFDESGNYSGNWKQMTNVSSQRQKSFSSSEYTTSAWYANNNKQKAINNKNSFTSTGYAEANTVPFRYNTLNYTRVRKVKGGHGDYNAKCSDIGDASFCR